MKTIKQIFVLVVIVAAGVFIYSFWRQHVHENKVFKEIIARLEADSRIAEVLVTAVQFDEASGTVNTTIKFLEYDADQQPLTAKYFTFSGNLIQFQSLVIRFDDIHIRNKDKLRGKSVYLFWKVFLLDGKNTQEYAITSAYQVPDGYRIAETSDTPFELSLWHKFWEYALNPASAKRMGIKNAQIEAPGTMFVPGTLYILKIEHDGGIRIDASPLPAILRGERIP